MKHLVFTAIFFFSCLFAKEPHIAVFLDPQQAGEAAAKKIATLILEKKDRPIVLGLATGSSPIPIYKALKKMIRELELDLSNVITFNLDEYVGLPPSHPESYRSFMFSQLFNDLLASPENPKGIKLENIHIPNGFCREEEDLTTDEELVALYQTFPERTQGAPLDSKEQIWITQRRAENYEKLIEEYGPIDLQILGIGTNGHIGFAEPGSSFSSRTGIVKLTEQTRKDNARFFDNQIELVPTHAVTMGIGTILQAQEILLISTGTAKANITKRTLDEPISNAIPATALRLHEKTSFFLDQSASRQLTKRFINGRILLDHQFQKGELWVIGESIVAPQKKADLTIDVQGALLAPGFIDLQINGGFGCDFSRNPEQAALVAQKLPQYGVTAFLPTIITSHSAQYRTLLPHLQPRSIERGATILGIHLEGPLLSTHCCGAHPKNLIPSSIESLSIDEIYGSLMGVKLVTLAPELPGAIQKIEQLKNQGIVIAAGHSNATLAQVRSAIIAGVACATHLFNAMRPYHHRDPGLIGEFLMQPGLPYSVIADNFHLSPETLALCWRCNPEGLFLISDAIEALGMVDGSYGLGKQEIDVRNGLPYLQGTEKIAGSVLSLDQAVRNLKAATNCTIVQALEAASLKPAQLINAYPKKGSLEIGSDADFILLSDHLSVQATYVGGQLIWQR